MAWNTRIARSPNKNTHIFSWKQVTLLSSTPMAFLIPLAAIAIDGTFRYLSAKARAGVPYGDLIQREREEADKRIRKIEEQLEHEREEGEKRRRESEARLKGELDASDERRKEMEDQLRAEMAEAEERQREIEERLTQERAEAEWKRQELEEKLRQEEERARAAEEARAIFEANWRNGTPPGISSLTPEQIRQARSSYLDGKVHIAVVGQSGSGKSTLTNCLRGKKATAPGAARVGQNECTRKVNRYTDPLHPQHVWYDVPGAGTLDCPDWHYFMDKELYVYDALIVVFSDRIMQNDVRVLDNAQELGIPTFLVRSKSEQIIRNMQSDFEEDARASKARYIRSTLDYVREILGQVASLNENQKVYMIARDGVMRAVKGNSASSDALDEQQLVEDLLEVQVADEGRFF